MITIDLTVMVSRPSLSASFFSRIITVVAAIIVCSINIDGVVLYFTLNVSPYTSVYELYMFVISIRYIALCTNIITVL